MIVLNNKKFKKDDEKLYGKDYPSYFKEIRENGMVVVDDVYSHMATTEFDTDYFKKLEIKSILDLPFIQNGKFEGVISCENQYEHRTWTIEETIMLKALGDFLSYTLVAHKLMKYNEELEE